ncbi:AI-2E family transporter [Cytobacillus sp. S13-E01]|uniref:AI-2E family transporter n=1 Tax=Cytobacillus sp. S13-E01 TaxID=3031326 RepID=UPI0023D8A57B|nr:AI-2E family transporter [Cytobacillus sp. S13-E01]MDF0728227.1 AI-2E family transporter [Cytobacillus sp. S13-E01]
MFKNKFHFWSLQLLIIVTILYLSSKITFLFEPVVVFFTTLFFPIIISGFLYFLLNPLVKILQKWRVPRILAIAIMYVVFIGLVGVVIGSLAPLISRQITELFNNLPLYAEQTKLLINGLSTSPQFKWVMTQSYVPITEVENELIRFANTLPDLASQAISNLLGLIANVTITIVTVPFLLFYMFKDGHRFPIALTKFFPVAYRKEGIETLKDTGNTLAAYIQGQVLVALFVGTLAFIGYLIIDLPYALVMAMIVAVTNIIPYVGPFLGGAPAVIIGLFESPTTGLLVVVVILIAQQVEGNLLSPLILGKRLDTHPATIIILLLVAGNLAGVLGMILAVPTYAVLKTIVLNAARLLRARKAHIEQEIE